MTTNAQMNTIKFLHKPGSAVKSPMAALLASLNGKQDAVYGGYSVGYVVWPHQIELGFAFCMNAGPEARDEFNKKEARRLIRERFNFGETLKLSPVELAPRCFTMPVEFSALTPNLIETLVSTFVRENQERLRHHAKVGLRSFVPVVDVFPRNPTKAEREATQAARVARRAARVAERGEVDPRGV